jgi:hypothetical protein
VVSLEKWSELELIQVKRTPQIEPDVMWRDPEVIIGPLKKSFLKEESSSIFLIKGTRREIHYYFHE